MWILQFSRGSNTPYYLVSGYFTHLLPIWPLEAFKFTTLKEDTNLLNPLKLELQWEMAGL